MSGEVSALAAALADVSEEVAKGAEKYIAMKKIVARNMDLIQDELAQVQFGRLVRLYWIQSILDDPFTDHSNAVRPGP